MLSNGRRGTNELNVLLTLTWCLYVLQKHTTVDSAPGCLSRRRIVKMIYFKLRVLDFTKPNPCAHMLPVAYGKRVSKIARKLKNLSEILGFSSPKTRFSSHKIRFSPTAFRFLQWLSAFFNGFLIFLKGFPIFLNGSPLSEKSVKIYLRQQVYERSLFELCIFCHPLPELRNFR
jgi:hypothetical protein